MTATTANTAQTESAERLARPLIQLAKLVGVSTSYMGMSHDYHEIDDEVLIAVLKALGIDASTEAKQNEAMKSITNDRKTRLVAPTVLHTAGKSDYVMVNTGILESPKATITLEDGTEYDGAIKVERVAGTAATVMGDSFMTTVGVKIPSDLPIGYHTLHVSIDDRTADATLISAPAKVELPKALKKGQLWGWMAQLYSIRSEGSWGTGDFEDLKTLLADAKKHTDADFILINPVHASEPVPPLEPSPYLPMSRRLVNFTYIRPESVPEYAELDDAAKRQIAALHQSMKSYNDSAEKIDRDTMWRTKMHALWIIFKEGRSNERQAAFDQFKDEWGNDLEAYATWCLCYDKLGAPEDNEKSWVKSLDRTSKKVTALTSQFPDTLDFYRWLEWIAVEQLNAAQQASKDAGMKIGLMQDMAVGVHPLSSDVWWNPERFATGVSVGAPPDMFNQQGQDWSQPPLNPLNLEQTGYMTYRQMVQGMFSRAGAVRIDHILGLFRLWWIPEGRPATDGTYVHYDSDIMLGILALEAARVGGVVVGEDLGVVPDYVADSLKSHGLLGCAVEWFEQFDGVFTEPAKWREYALASVNTHDMPPAAGYLEYEHVKIRERLGLLAGPVEDFQKSAEAEQTAMLTMLVKAGYLEADYAENAAEHESEIIDALYRALKGSPCKLLAASVVDAVGEKRTQNQPGTDDEYPNWRIPLADGDGKVVHVEGLFERDGAQRFAEIFNA